MKFLDYLLKLLNVRQQALNAGATMSEANTAAVIEVATEASTEQKPQSQTPAPKV